MLNALLLFAAATMTGQDKVEKFPIQHLPLDYAYSCLKDAPTTIPGLNRVTYDPTDNTLVVQGTPESLREFSKLLTSIDYQVKSRVVPVKYVDAQYLYEMLTSSGRFSTESPDGGFVPKGVSLAVDVHTNGIRTTGSEGGIRETELLIAMFDVRPISVGFDVQGWMPLVGRGFEFHGKVSNNSLFRYHEDPTGTSVHLTPRVNGDKTVTVIISAGTLGAEAKFAVRAKPGETVYARIYPGIGSLGGPTVLSAYGVGVPPADFLSGAPVSNDLGMFVKLDGPIKDAPESAELRLVLKFSLPEG